MGNDGFPETVHEERCVSCGQCVAICTQGALHHDKFQKENIRPIHRENIPSNDHLIELLKSRRSIRAFIDKTVEKQVLETVIDGARFAPSTNNLQSTQFLIVQNREVLDQISELTIRYLQSTLKNLRNPLLRSLFCLIKKQQAESLLQKLPDFATVINAYAQGRNLILYNAPVLLFFHADTRIGYGDVNASLAVENATLLAYSLGLGSFYAGYVVAASQQQEHIPRLLHLPKTHQIYGCLALGYPKLSFSSWVEKHPPNITWL
jgi:nitroreductase